MKITKQNKIISIILIILGILIIFSSVLFVEELHEVPCYDKYSNVIQGQTCLTDGSGYSPTLLIVVGFIIIAFGLFDNLFKKQNGSLESHAGLY